jgi:hypothetical protein
MKESGISLQQLTYERDSNDFTTSMKLIGRLYNILEPILGWLSI